MGGDDINGLQHAAGADRISKDLRRGSTRVRMIFVGLEIGGTNLGAGVLDGETGELLGRPQKEPLPKEPPAREPQALVRQLVALGQNALDELGLAWLDALHIGIACPGQIDREVGVVVGASTFPSWSNVPLASLVQEKTARPVTVLNDASAAASAEFANRGNQETIAVLTLGTGVGLGVVCAGRVLSGSRGLIEGGHMIVEPGPNGRVCPCGQRGCLEAYASGSAVAKIAAERMKDRARGSTGTTVPLDPLLGNNNNNSDSGNADGAEGMIEPLLSPARYSTVLSSSSSAAAQGTPGFQGRRLLRRASSGVGDRIREFERRKMSAETAAAAAVVVSPCSPPKACCASGSGSGSSPHAASVVLRPSPLSPVAALTSAPSFTCGDGSSNGGAAVTAEAVFAMARQGDAIAIGVVEETCGYIGLACVNICRMMDPDAILLSGGLANAEGLVDKVRAEFNTRGWNVLPHACEIALASSHSCSLGVVGAAGAAACEYAREKRHLRRRSSLSEPPSRQGHVGGHGHGEGRGEGEQRRSSCPSSSGANGNPFPSKSTNADDDGTATKKNGTTAAEQSGEWSLEGSAIVESGDVVVTQAGEEAARRGLCSPPPPEESCVVRRKGLLGRRTRRAWKLGENSTTGWFLLGAAVGAVASRVAVVALTAARRGGSGGRR